MKSVFRKQVQRFARAIARRSLKYAGIPLRDPALVAMFGLKESTAGVNVTEDTSLNFSAVYSAVNLISNTFAMLPFNLYDKKPRQGEESIINNHICNYLLSTKPNDYCTPFVFKQTQQAHALTWGNSYTEITRISKNGAPSGLRIIMPDTCTPAFRDNGDKYFVVRGYIPGEPSVREIENSDMLHVPGLGYDGIQGYSVIARARECIGLGIAAETFGASFFGNGAIPQGILTHPGDLSPEAETKLAKDFEEKHRGPSNGQRVAVLDEGMKYQHVGIPPEDAQFLQTRQFQVVEIARWFRVPPHMLYDMAAATFGNFEQSNMDFLTYTLVPWLMKWQEECNTKLLTEQEKEKYYFAHDPSMLLLPDMQKRYESYATGRNNGWLTLNDILKQERKPLLDPSIGDVRLAPSTMKVLGSADPTTPIDTAVIASAIAVIETMKPVKTADAKNIFNAAMPTANNAFIESLIAICKAKGAIGDTGATTSAVSIQSLVDISKKNN